MSRVVIVIPCYNEAARLDRAQVAELVDGADVETLLVDDGSTDGTLEVLEGLAAEHPGKVRVLALATNGGKAEAVRCGLREACASAEVVGYCDADFATPAHEMRRLVDELESTGVDVVTGARIARLGAEIDRHPGRHYVGRVFATAASLALGRPVYDTQCGAKVFRVDAALEDALATPFHSRWAFDVELLGRLLARGASIREIPLEIWHDVGGSKLRLRDMVKASLDLVAIARSLRRR